MKLTFSLKILIKILTDIIVIIPIKISYMFPFLYYFLGYIKNEKKKWLYSKYYENRNLYKKHLYDLTQYSIVNKLIISLTNTIAYKYPSK